MAWLIVVQFMIIWDLRGFDQSAWQKGIVVPREVVDYGLLVVGRLVC